MPSSNHDAVTVVVSCFNYGAYLQDAVDSLKTQDGGSPQITVVDDGSTDPATHEVLRRLDEDPDVQVVRQPNGGVARARNNGLFRAKTPLVMALDADDMLAPGALLALRAALDEHPEASYAYGQIKYFGNWAGEMRFPPYDPWRLAFRHIVGPTALMRRELIEATGGYDPDFKYYEDWELWVHALALGMHGVKVERPGHLYRKHGTSRVSSFRANYRRANRELRVKHEALYRDLAALRRSSRLGLRERLVYRWIWGERPWPAWAEDNAYALIWGLAGAVRGLRSTTSTQR
jgi:glycosyltransferase involved in cell wall biosynthesis